MARHTAKSHKIRKVEILVIQISKFDIQLVKSLVQKIEVSADKRIRIVFGFQNVFTELGKESAET